MRITSQFTCSSLRAQFLVLALALVASTSHAQIFVSNFTSGTIGEYNFDGTPVNTSLISGLSGPWSLAASDSNLFVATQSTGTVAKYSFDGIVVAPTLITGLDQPTGLAVYGSDLYISLSGSGSIGLYTLDGVLLNTLPITGPSQLGGLTVVTAIPEPGTYALLAGAATLLLVGITKNRSFLLFASA